MYHFNTSLHGSKRHSAPIPVLLGGILLVAYRELVDSFNFPQN